MRLRSPPAPGWDRAAAPAERPSRPFLPGPDQDPGSRTTLTSMAKVVLRVRLINGDRLDVTYDEPDTRDAEDVAERAIVALSENSGMIRARHGDRLVILYGRGVAALEVEPRGAVL